MKPLSPVICTVLFLIFAPGLGAGWLSQISRKPATWEFVQDSGGIEVLGCDDPHHLNCLKIRYDVTGLSCISTEPTIMHSGLAVADIRTDVREGKIFLYIYTAIPGRGVKNRTVHHAGLPELDPGTYMIYYGDVVDSGCHIGTVTIVENR